MTGARPLCKSTGHDGQSSHSLPSVILTLYTDLARDIVRDQPAYVRTLSFAPLLLGKENLCILRGERRRLLLAGGRTPAVNQALTDVPDQVRRADGLLIEDGLGALRAIHDSLPRRKEHEGRDQLVALNHRASPFGEADFIGPLRPNTD